MKYSQVMDRIKRIDSINFNLKKIQQLSRDGRSWIEENANTSDCVLNITESAVNLLTFYKEYLMQQINKAEIDI